MPTWERAPPFWLGNVNCGGRNREREREEERERERKREGESRPVSARRPYENIWPMGWKVPLAARCPLYERPSSSFPFPCSSRPETHEQCFWPGSRRHERAQKAVCFPSERAVRTHSATASRAAQKTAGSLAFGRHLWCSDTARIRAGCGTCAVRRAVHKVASERARGSPERLNCLLLHQTHRQQIGQPHHQCGRKVVARALGAGDEDELRAVAAVRRARGARVCGHTSRA